MTALLGDIHFGKNGFSMETYENQIAFYKNQFFPYLIENKIKRVITSGDFFDHRTRQDVNLLLRVKKDFLDFFEKNKIELIVILGNHDLYFKNSKEVYTLELFDNYKCLNIIKEPTILKIGKIDWELFPWMLEDDTFEPKTKHLIGHFEINGFNMVGNFTCTFGMNPSSLKTMEKVLSGHFHLKQEKGPITYLGTPYSMDWNDVNDNKGFYVLNNDGDIEFIENNISINYYEFEAQTIESIVKYYDKNNKEYSLEEINNLSTNGHKIRINSDQSVNLGINNNIIINIDETNNVDDSHQDVDKFVKDSLSENGYNEFVKLYIDINNN